MPGGRVRVTHRAFRDTLREEAAPAVACLRLKQKPAALLAAEQIDNAEATSDFATAVLRARGIE